MIPLVAKIHNYGLKLLCNDQQTRFWHAMYSPTNYPFINLCKLCITKMNMGTLLAANSHAVAFKY